MLRPAIGYVVALVTFFSVDMVWLGTMASRFYKPIMADIALVDVNLPPAIVFYMMYPIGLWIFAVEPALRSGGWTSALIYGALFGLFTYATYDLSNQATLRNWNMTLTLVDMSWGTFLGALASVVTYVVISRFVPAG